MRTDLTRVTAQSSKGHGVEIVSVTPESDHSSSTKLTKVMAIDNALSGLHIVNTNDTYVNQSDFANNGQYGVFLDGASALRISNSDVGGNALAGLYAHRSSSGLPASFLIAIGNQFGNNLGDDILIDGGTTYDAGGSHSNLIGNNTFIGSADRDNPNYSAIHLLNSFGNNVVGNIIIMESNGESLKHGVFVETIGGPGWGDLVTANVVNTSNVSADPIEPTSATMVTGNFCGAAPCVTP
jgi:hypothetical protein